jgi:hypothetical protein
MVRDIEIENEKIGPLDKGRLCVVSSYQPYVSLFWRVQK